jgi:MarR family 2-MHQ and catechol resistance regulon transcriptional repressor
MPAADQAVRRGITLYVDDVRRDPLASRIATVDRAKYPGADVLAQETSLTLIRAFGTLTGLMDEHLACMGLSRAKLHVLAFLNRAEGDVRMTDIGQWLGVTKAHVTRLVDDLEHDGLAARVASPSDRRATHVQITAEGRQRLDHALPPHLEHLSTLLAGLAEDEKLVLIHLVTKAREHMLEAAGRAAEAQPAFPV